MGSSGIGVSLKKRLTAPPWHPACLGLAALLVAGSAPALRAQAPDRAADPADLPRFTLREIVSGRNDSLSRIPGPWVGTARTTAPESLAMTAYIAAAARSGIAPLQGSTLASQRSQHVMGLYRRPELLMASRRTLEAIRAAIPSDTTRAHFDRIFRPRGEWVVDLHDAALAWARARVPGLNWDSARRALSSTGWLAPHDSSGTLESVPRALYGLMVLAANDSVAFAGVQGDLRRADSTSAAAVTALLSGYTEGEHWFTEAVGFFLTQPWVPEGKQGRSLGDYVQDDWRRGSSQPDSENATPEIRTRLFGYPQAVPHYGVPPALFKRLVRSDNEQAGEWLDRHGPAALLSALRQLPPGDTSLALLQVGTETVRLTSVPRQARESLNGFLEPRDAIAIDPGYAPLLALGAVVHEWQHLIFRRRQLEAFAGAMGNRGSSPILDLPGVDPYLAEGFAEWSAERILAPLVARWPLLGLGEIQKRAGLARENADDQHALGYALMRELAAAVPNPAAATELVLRYAEDPSRMVTEPVLRDAWKRHRRARDYVFAAPARRLLIPEITFTIEDGYPDVIATRILVPPSSKGGR